jgi:hypothetical protein
MTKRPRPARPSLNQPQLRLRAPVDVLAAVPYLIGYQPTDSVVVLAMRGRRLYFTVRDDLPGPDASVDEVGLTVDDLVDMVLRQRVSGVILVAYGPDGPARRVLFGLRSAFDTAGLAVLEMLRAADGRYWSYLCANPDCCPPEGVPYDVHSSTVPAVATVAGCVALPDREAYESLVRPDNGPGLVAVARATVRAGDRLLTLVSTGGQSAVLAAGRVAVDDALAGQLDGGRLDDDDLAWLTVLLTSIPVRDMAMSAITGPPPALEAHRALWMDVFRRAAPDFAAAPGSLFAFAAWRCGEATLARIALDRVLDAKPDYYLAVLLHRIMVAGLPPSVLDDLGNLDGSDDLDDLRDLDNLRGLGGLDALGELAGLGEGPVRRRPGRRRRRRSSSRRAGNR